MLLRDASARASLEQTHYKREDTYLLWWQRNLLYLLEHESAQQCEREK
jgi:hypothetical protein